MSRDRDFFEELEAERPPQADEASADEASAESEPEPAEARTETEPELTEARTETEPEPEPTSEEDLVIVRYDDESMLAAAEAAATTSAGGGEGEGEGDDSADSEPDPPESELVILRSAADEFAMEVPEHEKQRAQAEPPPPPPAPRPPAAPQAPEGAPALDVMDRNEMGRKNSTGEIAAPSSVADGAIAGKAAAETDAGADADADAEGGGTALGIDWNAELGLGPARLGEGGGRRIESRRGERPVPPDARPARTASPFPPPPRISRLIAVASVPVIVASGVLSALGIEPFPTWMYLFAWYPFLVLVNHLTAVRSLEHTLFGPRAGALLRLMAWSVPAWLFFEAWNFRLEDWYYVGVPDAWALRHVGTILSFATVLPGLFFVEEAFAVRGLFARMQTKAFRPGPRLLRGLEIAGGAVALGVLAFPTFLFPLVWGVPLLLLEPWLARSGGSSLLTELAAGRAGRTVRLLLAGLVCGLFWEAANFVAGARWIYSVPGLETIKLFEMPPLGFLGFPPFALACWSMAKALVRLGLMPDWEVEAGAAEKPEPPENAGGEKPEDAADEDGKSAVDAVEIPTAGDAAAIAPRAGLLAPALRPIVVAAVVAASIGVLAGMDRWTVDSTTPRPENLPGIPDGVSEWARPRGGADVRGLLELIQDGALYIPGESSEIAIERLEQHARLALLRGIGTENARRLDRVGVATIAELAARDRDELTAALAALDEPGWRPRPRRVGVWIAGARKTAGR